MYGIDGAADGMDAKERHTKYMTELHNNREGDLHLEDGYHCPICKNKGYTLKAEYTQFGYWTEVQYPCKCMTMRKAIKQMKKSGLEPLIGRYTMQAYRTEAPWQQGVKGTAEQYVNQCKGSDGHNWFYIGGTSGSGKTHICTAICRELLLSGMEVRYMLWRDEVVQLKAQVNDAAAYEQTMHVLKHVPVLYIDDLFKQGNGNNGDTGHQKPTTADINIAFELLNYRYNNPNLITILSSECTTSDLLDIDEAVGGRVIERAGAYTVNLTGAKNYRVQ